MRKRLILRTRSRPVFALFLSFGLSPSYAGAQWRMDVDGVPVCTAAAGQVPEAIVADHTGGAIVAWRDFRNGNNDIYAHHLLASGKVDHRWPTNGRALCTAPGEQWSTVMVPDGAGGAIVAWHDFRSGILGGSGDIYAQHVMASGVVDPVWPVNGRAVSAAPGDQYFPSIASDGAGGAIVAWRDTRNGNPDVYAQHVLTSGVLDPAWPVGGRAVCTAPGGVGSIRMAADGRGGAIIAWSDTRNDDADIYTHHVLATGAVDPAWPVDGRALCSGRAEQDNPVMIADGAGGAIVVWTDAHRGPDGFYTGTYDLYAQHLMATGAPDPNWPANALAVSTASDDQLLGEIISDRSGGAIVAWLDLRNGFRDIYAQHVLGDGVMDPDWPRDGLAICTAPRGDRNAPALVEDGRGGAFIAWDDRRVTNYDIYAQHVETSGAVHRGWPNDGRALCAASGDQQGALIAAVGAGQAIVTWRDEGDIYARRVSARDAVVLPRPRSAGTFRLHPAVRNSARGEVTIRFDLPAVQQVTVELFDLAGRAVRTLVTREDLGAGTHDVVWDGVDGSGVRLPRGVYLVRVSAGPTAVTGKILILR